MKKGIFWVAYFWIELVFANCKKEKAEHIVTLGGLFSFRELQVPFYW